MKASNGSLAGLKLDYTELYIPEIKIPKTLQEKLLLALTESDAAAGEYFREEILRYCYFACIEQAELKEMDTDIARREGKRHGSKVNKDILDRQREWQASADKIWRHRPELSINAVAKIIAGNENQSWNTIKKCIKK